VLNKLKQIIALTAQPAKRPNYSYARIAQPEPPLGFVPRSDPNYYFLRNR
jgi:hypothetical protein